MTFSDRLRADLWPLIGSLAQRDMREQADRRRPTTLYRYFDSEGRLLYVGITSSYLNRGEQHAMRAQWWPLIATATFEHFPDRTSALRAESDAIKTEQPLYNVGQTPWQRRGINSRSFHFVRVDPPAPAGITEMEERITLFRKMETLTEFLRALNRSGWPEIW